MLILTFEEFNNKFNIDNKAMTDIRIKDIGKDISLTPIEIVMRDQTPDSIRDHNFNIIVNLHPTEGTHWVLVIRREDTRSGWGTKTEGPSTEGPVYYFDSFGVETPPLFLEKYVDLGSNEKIQQNDESYCGAYCLYMIYLIDRGFRIKSALNILVNQCKYPGIYNECFCLSCSRGGDKDKDNVNDNVNQGTCFADDLRSSFANNDNDNVNDNDLRSSFANNVNDKDNVIDNDNFIYLFDEKYQRSKSNRNSNSNSISNSPTNNIREAVSPISVNLNDDLYLWLNDDDIITEAAFPDNFRCIISGPSECGKTFSLKKLILASIYFDKLYIIGPTGDQYHGIERINPKADVEFIKDIKDLPSPDKLPKDLKKLMIFDDVRAKEPVINEYFCRGRHNNCNMIYLNQNLFSLDRQSVRENCNLFILFEQRGKVLISIYQDFLKNVELSYNDFANICNKVWKEPYNYIVIDITKNKNMNGKLRINCDRRVL